MTAFRCDLHPIDETRDGRGGWQCSREGCRRIIWSNRTAPIATCRLSPPDPPRPQPKGLGTRLARLLARFGITPAWWQKKTGGYCIAGGGMTACVVRDGRECGCRDRRRALDVIAPW